VCLLFLRSKYFIFHVMVLFLFAMLFFITYVLNIALCFNILLLTLCDRNIRVLRSKLCIFKRQNVTFYSKKKMIPKGPCVINFKEMQLFNFHFKVLYIAII